MFGLFSNELVHKKLEGFYLFEFLLYISVSSLLMLLLSAFIINFYKHHVDSGLQDSLDMQMVYSIFINDYFLSEQIVVHEVDNISFIEITTALNNYNWILKGDNLMRSINNKFSNVIIKNVNQFVCKINNGYINFFLELKSGIELRSIIKLRV